MKVKLYDFRWLDEKHCEFQANLDGKFARRRIKINDQLSIELMSKVFCAGSVRDGLYQQCPAQSEGKKKCQICKAREGNFIFTVFDGFDKSNINLEDLEKIKGEHIVYLALINKNTIKVGVSKIERKILRQLEQGALFTLYIAKTIDGILARQIETLLRASGVADKIRISQKKGFFCPEINAKEGERLLLDLWKEKQKTLEKYTKLKSYFLEKVEFFDWSNIFGLEKVKNNQKPFHEVTLIQGEFVSGKIIAIKGSFLVLETDEDLLSICTKDLLGYDINFEDKPSGMKLNTAFQQSLF